MSCCTFIYTLVDFSYYLNLSLFFLLSLIFVDLIMSHLVYVGWQQLALVRLTAKLSLRYWHYEGSYDSLNWQLTISPVMIT